MIATHTGLHFAAGSNLVQLYILRLPNEGEEYRSSVTTRFRTALETTGYLVDDKSSD
jgi:hypothetical protein